MDNRVNFTSARSNQYFAITKRVWNNAIPNAAYKQIDAKRKQLEQFAKENNIKITFTDGRNLLSEIHSSKESLYLSNKLVMEVEKKPSLISKIRKNLSNLGSKMIGKSDNAKLVDSTSYYDKYSKNIPTLEQNGRIGLFVEYELTEKFMDLQIDFNIVIDFLQKVVGKKIK